MKYRDFKHLIFDLGGVIINLDTSLTVKAFSNLTKLPVAKIKELMLSEPVFLQYEKGEISSTTFRESIRKQTSLSISDRQIDAAWNAMILDLPIERIALLKRLKEHFDIFLLSNTNEIHMLRVNEVRIDAGIEPFPLLFDKDYYSHIMGKRKPDSECFDQVIRENNLDPDKTLFLDDNFENIHGAARLGIKTLHVTSPKVMMDFFENERTN